MAEKTRVETDGRVVYVLQKVENRIEVYDDYTPDDPQDFSYSLLFKKSDENDEVVVMSKKRTCIDDDYKSIIKTALGEHFDSPIALLSSPEDVELLFDSGIPSKKKSKRVISDRE